MTETVTPGTELETTRPDREDEVEPTTDATTETTKPVIYGAATAEQVGSLWSETPEDEIHYRQAMGRNGQAVMKDGAPLMLAYVTARYVQERLDLTVGAGCWQSVFENLPNGAVRCGIGILVARHASTDGKEFFGEWIWKYDVGTPTQVEPDKGAHSDAFKRAAVQWGVARDLYDDRDDREPVQPAAVAAVPAGATVQNVRQQIYADAPPQPVVAAAQPVGADGTVAITANAAPMGIPVGMVPEWICPIHNDVQIIPAGTSKRTNRQYPAFYGCPIPGCDETGGNIRPPVQS